MKKRVSDGDFFQKVYDVTCLIPYGRVTTYGAIAAYIGSPGAARMVGWALNKSFSQSVFIPAHRVVNRNGLLTGKNHFPGGEMMQELLRNEGVKVEDNQVVEMRKHFWDPSVDLDL
jgi:methylated-DNA-protein-cysteine methyltransferase-like protein